jgi:hypothetical protein
MTVDIPDPLPEADLYPDVKTMDADALERARVDIDERLKRKLLTPDGRRMLRFRLKDVRAEIAHREETAEMVKRYQT